MVLYLIAMRVVAQRYFARRHGVPLERGEPGWMAAAHIGLAWPLTVWMEQVRRPDLCGHVRHVEQRNRVLAQLRRAEEMRRQEVEERDRRRRGR